MIKVAQVVTDTNIGGAGIWLLNFLKSYDREKIEMTVVLPMSSKLKEKVKEAGVNVIEAEGIEDCSFSVSGIKSLNKIFKELEPDIVHTHASLSARIAAKINKILVVNTRHCLEDKKSFIKTGVYGFINNLLSDRVIGVSEAVCENLRLDGIKEDKLGMVYNGIKPLKKITNTEKEFIRRRYGISQDKTIVGVVARLEPVKNHYMFLEAAKAVATICPEAMFMIVGEGSLMDDLKKKAIDDGIENKVIFTGYIDNVNDIMNVIDIHVLTSIKEALSISLIEAMSIGKPVIATMSGGPEEVVENMKNGILVGTDDVVNLTMAIVRFIQRPDIREAMGKNGEKIVADKFMVESMARAIEDIYVEMKGEMVRK